MRYSAGQQPVTAPPAGPGDLVLRVASLNLQDGRELFLLPHLVMEIPGIDILLLQEARSFNEAGQRARFLVEDNMAALTGLDRTFLTRSRRGTLHQVVFIRSSRLRPVAHFTPDLPDVFADQAGWIYLDVKGPGLTPLLAVRSVHWASWSGDVRLDEALQLTRHAAPGSAAIIGGDFNSTWPDCPGHPPEFEPDWAALPPHKRLHKTLPPGTRPGGRLASDRRALTVLAEAGFVSAGCAAGDVTVTVNAAADCGQGARIDHLVLSPRLAPCIIPGTYQVHISEDGDRASDHRLVSVSLDLSQLPRHLPGPGTLHR